MPASRVFCPRLFIPEARDTGTARACLKSRLLDYDECKITLATTHGLHKPDYPCFFNFLQADKSWTCLHPVFLKFSSLFTSVKDQEMPVRYLFIDQFSKASFPVEFYLFHREEPLSCWLQSTIQGHSNESSVNCMSTSFREGTQWSYIEGPRPEVRPLTFYIPSLTE